MLITRSTISALGQGLASAASVGLAVGAAPNISKDPNRRQIFKDVVTLTYALSKFYFGNKIPPAAVVAGIPLGSVESLSHGISDREVRYRAQGGVFLAHQDGGNESLRITGKAWGSNRFVFLNMLDYLFLYGEATPIDIFKRDPSGTMTIAAGEDRLPDLTKDPWKVVEGARTSEGYQETRWTFPVITSTRVYLSMYIETYSWRQEIDINGRESITYTIFFRKFDPHINYELRNLIIENENPDKDDKEILVYKKETEVKMQNAMLKTSIEVFSSILINIEVFDSMFSFANQFARNLFGIRVQQDENGNPPTGDSTYPGEGFF